MFEYKILERIERINVDVCVERWRLDDGEEEEDEDEDQTDDEDEEEEHDENDEDDDEDEEEHESSPINDLKCEKLLPNGRCETCYKGFEIFGGKCFKIARIEREAFCLHDCEECPPGLEEVDDKCTSPYCKEGELTFFNGQIGFKCTECREGSGLNSMTNYFEGKHPEFSEPFLPKC